MRAKYHSHSFTNAEGKWDSVNEYRRYVYLNNLQAEGKIKNLRRQVEYELIPRQCAIEVEHKKTKDVPKVRFIEHPCVYTADFVYIVTNTDGIDVEIVEDFKGFRTPEYIIKRKLMLYKYGIEIKEVEKPGEAI